MTEAEYKILCSLNNKFDSLHEKWVKELKGVNSSLVPVNNNKKVPQTLAGRNQNRVAIWICNYSNQNLFIAPFQGEVSRNLFSTIIAPNDTLIMNAHNFAHLYKDQILGFWDEAAGTTSIAMVTEYYLES